MKIVQSFDPSIPAAKGVLDTLGVNRNEQLMLYNDSLYGLQLTFSDGSVDILPASWNKSFTIRNVPMGKVNWQVYNVIISTGYPVALVYGTIYEDGEHVPDVNAGMQRGFQITGGGLSQQTIINDGSVDGTEVIEMSTPAATGSTTAIFNNGLMTLKVAQTGVLHQFLNSQSSGNPLQLGQAGDITEILGKLTVDQLLTLASAGLTSPAATDAAYNVPTGQKHNFEVNAISQMTLTNALLNVVNALTVSGLITTGATGITSPAATDLIHNVPTGQGHSLQVNAVERLRIDATNGLVSSFAAQFLNGLTTPNVNGSAALDLVLNAVTGQKHNFEINAVSVMTIAVAAITLNQILNLASTGIHWANSTVNPSITRKSDGFTAAVTTGTVVAHGLGVTPNTVLVTANNNFTCFVSSVGATNFTLNPSVNGNVWWVAMVH